jgi:hypothetical protein
MSPRGSTAGKAAVVLCIHCGKPYPQLRLPAHTAKCQKQLALAESRKQRQLTKAGSSSSSGGRAPVTAVAQLAPREPRHFAVAEVSNSILCAVHVGSAHMDACRATHTRSAQSALLCAVTYDMQRGEVT